MGRVVVAAKDVERAWQEAELDRRLRELLGEGK